MDKSNAIGQALERALEDVQAAQERHLKSREDSSYDVERRLEIMDRYVCSVCGYVYDPAEGDPDNGIEPETKFEDLPDDWTCPVCGAEKDQFEKEG